MSGVLQREKPPQWVVKAGSINQFGMFGKTGCLIKKTT